MKRASIPVVVMVATFAVAAVACQRDRTERKPVDFNRQDPSGVTTLTGAAWVANDAAIDRLVASRCAREISCNAIGPDRPFTSSEICVREVRKNLTADLATSECPAGIDGHELDTCLDAIRTESCMNPLETLGRLTACRPGVLCMKAEMPHR
jgi:hypothetical protein